MISKLDPIQAELTQPEHQISSIQEIEVPAQFEFLCSLQRSLQNITEETIEGIAQFILLSSSFDIHQAFNIIPSSHHFIRFDAVNIKSFWIFS
jgi:hypothetical protein